MKKIELASDAQSDLLEIWVYLGEKSVRLADRIALQIEQKIDTLSLFPAMGRSRDELQKGLRSASCRRLPYFLSKSGGKNNSPSRFAWIT